MPQLPNLLDEQLFDFVRRLERALLVARQVQDALHPLPQLRMLPQPFQEPGFGNGDLLLDCFFVRHPDRI